MLIQDPVDPKSYFDANNDPTDLTPYEAISEAQKSILAARVRQYIKREEIIYSNMNRIYGIIWGQCIPGLQSVLNWNENYPTKFKMLNFELIWLMREPNNITASIDVKLNKSASLYCAVRGFMNMRQGQNWAQWHLQVAFWKHLWNYRTWQQGKHPPQRITN